MLRIFDFGEQRGDGRVGYLTEESVAAQQVAIADHEVHQPGVDLHPRLDAEGAGHDVALRVRARLGLGELTGRHEIGDVRVIARGAARGFHRGSGRRASHRH